MKIKSLLIGGIGALLVNASCANAKAHIGSDLPLIGNVPAASKLIKAGDTAFAATRMFEALADYQAALDACPAYEDAEIGAARCCAALGDYDNAITYYRESINGHHEEDDIDEQAEYIVVLTQAGQEQDAIAAYDHIAGLCAKGLTLRKMEIAPPTFLPDGSDYDPNEMQAMTHLMQAMDCDSEGDAQAAAEIEKATALAPDSALVYFYQGVLLSRTDKSGARKAFRQALALDDGSNTRVIEKWTALVE